MRSHLILRVRQALHAITDAAKVQGPESKVQDARARRLKRRRGRTRSCAPPWKSGRGFGKGEGVASEDDLRVDGAFGAPEYVIVGSAVQ